MTTIKAVIRKDKIKADGTTKVNIAIGHKQATAYISTNIVCKADNFVNGRIVRGTNANAHNAEIIALVNEYKEKLDDIANIDYLSVVQVKERLVCSARRKATLLSEVIALMMDDARSDNARKILKNTSARLLAYNKGKDVCIMSVDRVYVNNFYKYLNNAVCFKGTKYKPQTIKTYMVRLKEVVDYATKKGLLKYDVSPFADIRLIQDVVRENRVTNEDLKRLWEYKPNDKREELAMDLFFISFFSGGMNMIDIVRTRFDDDVVEYKRSKIEERTAGRYTIRFKVSPELRQIVYKYIDEKTGMLDFRKSGLIKDATYANNDYAKISRNIVAFIDEQYREIREKLNIKGLTFYSARKCFAQIGLNLGISDNVIDYLLGHTPTKRGMISAYSRVNEELGEMAMELIFEYAFNPADLRQIFRKNILQKLNE